MATALDTLDVQVTVRGDQPITIPDAVREGLGLEDGDLLRFVGENGRVVVEREVRTSASEAHGSVIPDLRRMPLDEIIADSQTTTGPHSDDFDVEIEEAMEIETCQTLDRTSKVQSREPRSLEDVIGMFVLPSPPSENFREERDAAWEQVARERVERMRKNALPE